MRTTCIYRIQWNTVTKSNDLCFDAATGDRKENGSFDCGKDKQ